MTNNELLFEGIGTHWWIKIYDEINKEDLDSLYTEIISILRTFENNYSRFKDKSFIGKLNKKKSIKNFPEEMYTMFKYAEDIKSITHGNFDISIGTVLENLGYDKDYSFKSKEKNISLENSFEKLTPLEIVINKNITVDLGGIGKGWIIDKIKNHLFEKDIKEFTINGGGDIFSITKDPSSFYLENPFNIKEYIGEISISNQSIACSSGNRRAWRDKNTGELHHHLISAKTLKEANEIAAVFTQGKDALSADTASTAIFVSPYSLLKDIVNKLNVEFLIIFSDGQYIKSENYLGILNL